MRDFVVALAALCATTAHSQLLAAERQYAPIPYHFAYKADSNEGSHGQQEVSDANGRRRGSYTISLADGRQRIVNYVADELGFRAEVSTNELGTESKDTGDVHFTSSAITGKQAAIQFGAQPQHSRLRHPSSVITTFSNRLSSSVTRYSANSPTVIRRIQASPAYYSIFSHSSPVFHSGHSIVLQHRA